jgi:hypothetical protein
MCTSDTTTRDPAEALADLILAATGHHISPYNIRLLIRKRWNDIKPLAHKIHEQECPSIEMRVRDAAVRFNLLSPDEKRKMREAQKRSWVIGETMLAHPEMTRDEAERLYDKVISS